MGPPSEYAEWAPHTPPQMVETASAVNPAAESNAAQSFRERWGERIGFAVEVAKRVGRAAVDGVVSMDRADREGTATDAHAPMSERVADRAERSEFLPAYGAEQEQNDRAGVWARRIVKGVGYALTAAKVIKVAKSLKKVK